MGETALHLSNFTLHVSGRTVLSDISLKIEKGKTVLLYGPRGSGKSAFMRSFVHLNEELFDDVIGEGNVSFFGKDLNAIDSKELRNDIAYVDTTFLEAVSNFTIIEFFKFLKGRNFVFERLSDEELTLIEKLQLTEILEIDKRTPLRSIPPFQRLSLLIYSTLTRKPEIIMLDNILDHLDDDACNKVKNILMDSREDRTVIISSRYISRLLDISDLLIFMKNGKILYVGSPEKFVTEAD